MKRFRLWLIKKLLKNNDGYTFTGFWGEEPIKFYYKEDEDIYLLGMRSDTWYYFIPGISGWSSYSSRYLDWGDANGKEPVEVDFQVWIYGIFETIFKSYKASLALNNSAEVK